MDDKLLLVRCIMLFFRESQLLHNDNSSKDIILNAVNFVKIPESSMGINSERESLLSLKNLCIEMSNNEYIFDKEIILQGVRLTCYNDEEIYKALEQGLSDEVNEKQIKRQINSLKVSISNYIKDQKISELLYKASYSFRFNREKISNVDEFLNKLINELEPLQVDSKVRDKAIIEEIDMKDTSSLDRAFQQIEHLHSGDGGIMTGFIDLNHALDGCIRRGEFIMINALEHNYKTGFSLSIFMQTALHNKPYMLDPNKKPLIVLFSFEDDLGPSLKFMYEYLKYTEVRERVSTSNLSNSDLSSYIQSRLQVNGYEIKLLRIDPTLWTYKDVCSKIVEYETEGYEIHLLLMDYMSKLPRTGCNNTGPMGTDLRDMILRFRNFFGPRKITCITPHQLSSDVKSLTRGVITDEELVKEIHGKGYYEGSKQLGQEIDVDIYLHIVKIKYPDGITRSYLAVQVGKHRGFRNPSYEERCFYLPFPLGMPIPDDITGEKSSFRRIPKTIETRSSNYEF